MKKNEVYIPVIDSLRGIAALSVCLYHFVCTTIGYVQNQTILNVFHFGEKGVQLFFIISGVVIPLSMIKGDYNYRSFPQFIAKRFVRIEPPYLVAIVIGIFYLIIRNAVPSSTPIDLIPSFRDIVLHLGYLVPFFDDAKWVNQVFWTLAIEFQYYLFLALMFPLSLSNKLLLRSVFYLSMLVPSFLLPSANFFPHWAAYFALGVFYILYVSDKINFKEYFTVTIMAFIIVIVKQGYVDFIIAVGALLIIHFFSSYKNYIGKQLGNISYSLYLLHSIVGSAFVNFMSHKYTESYQKVIVITFGIIISILCSFFLYKYIEKPSQRFSQKIKLNSKNK